MLILTARDSVEDRVAGLDAGADDYLDKPFAHAEFLARLRAVLRRSYSVSENTLRCDDLQMQLLSRSVTRQNIAIELSQREFELLEYLLRNKNITVTREMLARDVWKEPSGVMTNVIDVCINSLPKRLNCREHGTLVVNLHHMNEEMGQVIAALVATIPVCLALAATLAYWLAWKALAPVEELRRRPEETTAERLHQRLPIFNARDELGQLAQTINAMIERLETSFDEIKRFTADASHELRTPLAIIQSEAELGLEEGADASAIQHCYGAVARGCRHPGRTNAEV